MRKFFTSIAIVAIVYFGITEYVKHQDINIAPDKSSPTTEEIASDKMVGSFAEKAISNIFINILKTPAGKDAFAKIVEPIGIAQLQGGESFIIDMSNVNLIKSLFTIGTKGNKGSRQALCGQLVDVEYEIKDYSNGSIKKDRREIQLGLEDKDRAISSIIVGMYEGQNRTAKIPSKLLPIQYKDMDMPTEVSITLHQIKSPDLVNPDQIKMFDNKLTYQIPCLCAEKVKLGVKISSIDGKKIFESDANNPMEYRLGDNKLPVIFAYALFNKVKIGTRTVIAHGKYLNNFYGRRFTNGELDYNPDDYYIMEFMVAP